MRTLAVAAVALLGLAAPALAEVNVGVTAAVNPQATGAVGSNVRTIALGDSVIFNERIQTSAEGLVQILLADGTTFMVGPNSDLTIDSFVYDPAANTAQVTASFTKGVLRFIGGQTSKTENGVTLNTPVGTMGIRGAVVDVVLDPPPGTPQHIDMLFGNEVTLEQGQQLLGRLYAGGYSLVLGDSGVFEVMKTPPGWGSQIQAALAGRAGATGGAPKGPSDGDVKNSEVANKNSGKGPDKGGQPLSKEEIAALLEAAALYDELRNFILNNRGEDGFTGGVVNIAYQWPEGYWDENEGGFYDESRSEFLNASNPDTDEALLSTVVFDPNGVPVSIRVPIAFTGSGCEGACGQAYYLGTDGSGQLVVEINGSEGTYVTTDSYLKDHTAYLDEDHITGLELDCENCADFVRWGFWGFKGALNGVGEFDVDLESMWITGSLTTQAQLGNLAAQSESEISAFYHGDAVGIVNNLAVEGSYIASGNLEMEWNFGSRTGNASITQFDTENFSGQGRGFNYELEAPEGNSTFLGNLTSTDNPYIDSYGGMQGAFANNGANIAGGVIGNWGVSEYDWENEGNIPDYTVGGVFMGESYTPGN